jgi:hypothetical protein
MPQRSPEDRRLDPIAIRSRFIQESLRKALNGGDHLLASVMAHEFRRYFHWFRDSFSDADRRAIADQLSRLEESCRRRWQPLEGMSTYANRIGHQFQETTLA